MGEASSPPLRRPGLLRRIWRRLLIWGLRLLALLALLVLALRWINPPITPYQFSEYLRSGPLQRSWMPIAEMAPALPLAAVAAEDANFCDHMGFDFTAIRTVIATGGPGGASTISQQVAKNLFLWHGRSWLRKGLEVGFTLAIEILWPKQRILEIYLNIAEFDTITFGADAAARRYFDRGADTLTPRQAARLAMVLPNPKNRSASRISTRQARRVQAIMDGANILKKTGRAACFAG